MASDLTYLKKKIQYGREAEKENTKNATKTVTKTVTKAVTKAVTKRKELEFTEKKLHAGLSIKEVSEMMSVLTEHDVQKIAEKMNRQSDNQNNKGQK